MKFKLLALLLTLSSPIYAQSVFYPGNVSGSECNSTTFVRGDGRCVPIAIPSGSLLLILSGTCPTGSTEETALNGVMLRGTVVANGNVGTTSGSDTITPAGTNGTSTVTPLGSVATGTFTGTAWSAPALSWPAGVPTFAGNVLGTHLHGVGTLVNATGTVTPLGSNAAEATHTHTAGTFVNVATATTGNCAATNVLIGTGAANACKATAPNLTVPAESHSGTISAGSSHNHAFTGSSSVTSAQTISGSDAAITAGTPSGTNSWPAGVPTIGAYTPVGTIGSQTFTGQSSTVGAQVFTGTQFDNRPAYINVIFCRRD